MSMSIARCGDKGGIGIIQSSLLRIMVIIILITVNIIAIRRRGDIGWLIGSNAPPIEEFTPLPEIFTCGGFVWKVFGID